MENWESRVSGAGGRKMERVCGWVRNVRNERWRRSEERVGERERDRDREREREIKGERDQERERDGEERNMKG